MELVKLYTALLRRRWLVLQSVAFFVLVAVVLALVLPKNYTASARVWINSSDASLSVLSDLGLSEVAAGLNSASDDVADRIQLATTRPILDDVIWRLQLRDGDGALYTYDKVLVAGLTGELEARPHIQVTQQQGTALLVFEARADDPELARLLADTAVRVAIERSQASAREQTRDARTFIEAQLDVVRQEFDRALALISDAQAAEQVIDVESELKAAISRLSELMLEGEQNAAAVVEVRARLAEARGFQSEEDPTRIAASTLTANPQIEILQRDLNELRAARAEELQDKTPQHPDVGKIDALIADNEARLAAALAAQHALDPSVQALEAQLSGLIERGAEIQAAIARTTQTFAAWPDKMRRMAQLQLAAEAAEDVFKSLEEQRYQIGIAEAMLMSDLQLVEPAALPDRHSSPKVLVNLVLGLVLGLGFGLGLALVFEYVDDTVKTPEDVAELWPLPRFGLIPAFKLPSGRQIIDEVSPADPVFESYRAIRSALRFAALDRPIRALVVTSALPGEGKSTTTMNLAITLAREGARVLVMDADLRRPTQHRSFPSLSNARGLTSVLTDQCSLAAAIQPTGVPNLSVLASGPTPPDPVRLLESQRFRDLLAELRDGYDHVLVDTPPLLVVGDALSVGLLADGLLLVVGSQTTSRQLLADLRRRMEMASQRPLGFVMNRMDLQEAGYGQYLKAYKAYEAAASSAGEEGK